MAVTDPTSSEARGEHHLGSWTSVPHGPLSLSHHVLGARVSCLVVRGELDAGSVDVLERAVLAAWADGSELIVVDVRSLEFVDVAGLRLLDRLAAEGAAPTVLVESGPAVERLRRLVARVRHPSQCGRRVERAQSS
jgi:anti-anti-sigma factor